MTTKIIDGQNIKITRAGYVYVNGVKVTPRKYTPLVHPVCSMTHAQYEFVREWIDHSYVMV